MKQLGDLILPDSLQWIDRYSCSPVTQTVVQTVSGTSIVFGRTKAGGWPLTLVAEADVTWLDATTVAALMVMASQAGTTFPLRWENFSSMVLFRHQEPPALDLKPLWPHHDQFMGVIKLMAC